MAGSTKAVAAKPLFERPPLQFALLVILLLAVHRHLETLTRGLLILYAAAILGVALNGLVRRLPLRRGWASALIGLVIVASLVAAFWLSGRLVVDQFRGLVESVPEIRAEVERWLSSLGQRTGVPVRRLIGQAAAGLGTFLTGGGVLAGARSALDAVVLPLVILAGGLFAVGRPRSGLLSPLIRALPAHRRADAEHALSLLGKRLNGWVQGQLLAMLAVGVLATVAYLILRVPYAIVLGLLAGLTEFIPLLGPWLGGMPAVIVAAVDDPMKGVWTALVILGIQQIESAVVTPWAMAQHARVHPFITLFSLVFFGGMFGFLGVLLAIPIVLLMWTALEVFWVDKLA